MDKVLSYVKYAVPIGLLVLHNYDVWSEKMPTALFGHFNTLPPAPPVIDQAEEEFNCQNSQTFATVPEIDRRRMLSEDRISILLFVYFQIFG